MQFSKYQGLGNDFLILEGRSGQLPPSITDPDPAWVRLLCDRRFGVGADGLILALPADGDADRRRPPRPLPARRRRRARRLVRRPPGVLGRLLARDGVLRARDGFGAADQEGTVTGSGYGG